jgi:tRNA nucleotidyltransferase/poly(A) polymerase
MAGEMHKTLITSGRETAVREWAETGMLAVLLPAVAAHWPALAEQACALVRAVRPDNWIAPLAALHYPLVRREKNEPRLLQELVADLKTRLKLSNDDLAGLKFALESQACFEAALQLPWSEVQPQLVNPLAEVALELLAARIACGEAEAETLDWLRSRLSQAAESINPPPLVTGHDLHQLGLPAGPTFKEMLARVRAAQLDGQITTREQALEMLGRELNR